MLVLARLSSLAFLAWGWLAPGSFPAPGGSDGGAVDSRADGRTGCRIERPASWKGDRVTWLGSCQKGFAHGNGVLLEEIEGVEPDRFYGRVEHGHLSVGVIQTTGGYIAGNWVHGALAKPLADDMAQRNAVIAAFQTAAKAATSVSKSFAKQGDAKSSRAYAQQARQLRDQMD